MVKTHYTSQSKSTNTLHEPIKKHQHVTPSQSKSAKTNRNTPCGRPPALHPSPDAASVAPPPPDSSPSTPLLRAAWYPL